MEVVLIIAAGGARHSEEEFYWKLHGFKVPDIDDPDTGCAVMQREVHLLPDLGNGIGIEPLIGAWAADIVEVVIDAGTAGTLALARGGQAAQVAPIVVGPEQRDVVGYAHALVVIALHLLIERPVLRHFI